MNTSNLILENSLFRLELTPVAVPVSLVLKSTGEELLFPDPTLSLFSVTQDRPFNNEVKLAHPNKHTTFQANRVERDEKAPELLHVGFETVPVKANIRVKVTDAYLSFELVDFTVLPDDYGHLRMKLPPVAELRLCQLPVKNREKFGEWLNVVWDDRAAVNLLATSPCARIDSERRNGYRVLTADAVRGIQLEGCSAVLIVSKPEELLDNIQVMEHDYHLPDGVASRRSNLINASLYQTGTINPKNVDEHIAYAKKGGFRLMMISYIAIFKFDGDYGHEGDYDYNENYPNGRADLAEVLAKIRAAGILPGIHFLQTHIGLKSRYVKGKADYRLRKSRYFTLAKDLRDGDTELFVQENPTGIVLDPPCRFLQFGGELISYENYTVTPPYRFTGIKRGGWATTPEEHCQGQIGGLLDISEYGAKSCYIDQNTDLQDEVADKLADAYNAGFAFCYMDGSEGTNIPYEYYIPLAQYRVYKKLNEAPLFTEGAAKAHFSWHMQAGGNAFDRFQPSEFKQKIAEHPAEEAPRMRMDFTRLDFGWWGYWPPCGRTEDNGTQADMYEYGTSLAAAWDCPTGIPGCIEDFKAHPRTDDILEVMRRWEDVRATNWLTEEAKAELKNTKQEHTLLINEEGEYELVPYDEISTAANLSAFVFERRNARYVVYWHQTGSGTVELPIASCKFKVYDKLGGEALEVKSENGALVLPADGKRYLRTELSREEIVKAFEGAKLG